MNGASTISESEILADVISVERGDLPPEVARSILEWKFSDGAATRMAELASRNNQGALSEAEREQLDRYLRVGGLVNLLQAKARLSLRESAADER